MKELKVHPHWWIKRMTRIKYGDKYVTLAICEMFDTIEEAGGSWSFCTFSGCPVHRCPSPIICFPPSDEETFKRLVLDLTLEKRLEDINYLPKTTIDFLKVKLEKKEEEK